jgi:lysophospholipase L1-like esterase
MNKTIHTVLTTIALLLCAHVSTAAESRIKIGLIGDSTVAEQSGWGPAFASRFNAHAEVINYAKNGATLQALSKKLDALVKLKPDYVLIQFGHNDQKRYDTTVYNFKEGDRTHFNRKGAEAITDLILKEIQTAVPEISTYLKP